MVGVVPQTNVIWHHTHSSTVEVFMQQSQYIDHTLLAPEATAAQIAQLCDEARTHGFFSVCVNPCRVAQAKAAQQAGADFIVSPGFNPNTVKACQDLGIAITPGINNPTAIEAALEHGITTVKYFPAEASGGLKMLKALLAPYAMLQVMPTGGIGTHNIRDYLALKNVIACGGSWMVEKTLLDAQNWEEIARLAREAAALVQN